MVEFIKNSTDFGLFILQGSIGGDDWLGDHDHIKEFDQDLGTEGTNFLHLPFVGKIRKTPNFNIQILDFFEGAGVDLTLPEGHWIFSSEGRFGGASETARNDKDAAIEDMFMNHLLLGTPLYLGYRKVGEIWKKFRDDDGATKYYLKGKLLLGESWREAWQNYIHWKIVFRGVW